MKTEKFYCGYAKALFSPAPSLPVPLSKDKPPPPKFILAMLLAPGIHFIIAIKKLDIIRKFCVRYQSSLESGGQNSHHLFEHQSESNLPGIL